MVTSKGHKIFIDMSWNRKSNLVDLHLEYDTINDKLLTTITPEPTLINILPKDDLDSINIDRKELETWINTVIHSIITKKGIHDIEENIRGNIIVDGSMERFCQELKSYAMFYDR